MKQNVILKMAEEHTAKKGKYQVSSRSIKSKYQVEWATLYPIGRATGNSFAFYCIPCKKNVSCSHMGLADVKQHCKGKTQYKMANTVKQCHKLAFPSSSTTVNDAQIYAETLAHNISLLTADYLALNI